MTDTFASGPNSPTGGSQQSPSTATNVTGTLAELERKLRELEQELSVIGKRREPNAPELRVDGPPAAARWTPGDAQPATDETQPTPTQPTQPQTQPQPTPTQPTTGGRLIDEAVEAYPASSPPPDDPSAPVDPAYERRARAEANPLPSTEPEPTGLAELWRFRDRLERFTQELGEDYEQALERATAELAASPPPAPSPDDTLFEGPVELGVGPFYDMGSLSTFERCVAGLAHTSDVAVRRFEASHAVLDLRVSTPSALIRELRRALDTDFSVREITGGRLMLTLDDI
jgi:hypothetical protein